ncbi:uncharacterized protein LOC128324210 isoform X3 [Hemicordylus capensis]|uniref:uncharacterized protein LOC128324210 isoform X3 n=1 Tax=Hemicordylus capensis TaxID=884348 RepID=UPI0023027876|nr:uncharacterized protein LOC128324210 isoform X3 [Hemicordylus capensis]
MRIVTGPNSDWFVIPRTAAVGSAAVAGSCLEQQAHSDVDRLYLPHSSGGRGMLQVHQTVEEEKRGLEEYIKDSEEDVLQMVKNEKLFNTNERKQAYKKEQVKNRAEKWRNKPLHGQYLHNISGKSDITKTWQWLKNGNLKKETEGLILAAQEQALRTNAIRASRKIHHKQQVPPL